MNRIVTNRCLLLTMVVLALLPSKGRASHLGAADLFVNYAGTGPTDLRYKVTLVVYRACELNALYNYNFDTVVVSSATCGVNPFALVVDTSGNNTRQIITNYCPQTPPDNACINPSSAWPAYEKWVYTAVVTLPAKCKDWVFLWSSDYRNAGVLNLCNAGSQNAAVSCSLNNLIRYDASTSHFTNDPLLYTPANQTTNIYNFAVDPDGDSISVVNAQPIGCAAASSCSCSSIDGIIPYALGYSLSSPVPSTSAYTVDPETGNAIFSPFYTGKFVVSFVCNKYDRQTKVLLGNTRRDIQIVVLNTNLTLDTIANPLNLKKCFYGTDNSIIVGYATDSISFTVSGQAYSTASKFYMEIVSNSSNGVFTIHNTGMSPETGTFKWAPLTKDTGTYTLTLYAVDSTCGSGASIIPVYYKTITIKVLPKPTSVVSVFSGQNISLYPNPSNGHFFLELNAGTGIKHLQINVMAITGQQVFSKSYENVASAFRDELDFTSLAQGFYYVIIDADGEKLSKKIVVQ